MYLEQLYTIETSASNGRTKTLPSAGKRTFELILKKGFQKFKVHDP